MPKSAEYYYEAWQRAGYDSPAVGLIIKDGPDKARPNPQTLQALGKELAIADPEVREKIVSLLEELGVYVEPLAPKVAMIRNPEIIALLAGPGLVKLDAAREKAMAALRRKVPSTDLAQYGDAFTKALAEEQSEDAFLLVAKAKPPQAKEVVNQLPINPLWREADRIARAALGDTKIEDEFLKRATQAEKTGDAEALAAALKTLAHIGTPRSLRAVAERLRTPLIIDLVSAYMRSVRLEAISALQYAFPEEPIFFSHRINSEEDYTAVERFCTEKLGVVYDMPVPPFFTEMGYPHPMPE